MGIEDTKFVGKDGYLVHPTGVKYKPDYGPGPKAGSNIQCFGHLMEKPNIANVSDLEDAISKMDEVEMRKVWIAGPDGNPVESSEFLGITSKTSGKTYAVGTDRYIPTQDKSFFRPVADAFKDRKLKIAGEVIGQGTGRTSALLVGYSPEFVIQLLNEYDDTIMVGTRISNSYDRLSKGQMDVLSVRMVCCNFGLWGESVKALNFKHVASYDELLSKFGHYIEHLIDKSDVLRDVVHVAEQTIITFKEAEALLWGLKMPILDIEDIISNPSAFMPEWKGRNATVKPTKLNAYELSCMTNAMITYRPYGKDVKAQRSEQLMEAASKILTPKFHDKLIEQGRKAKTAYDKSQAKKQIEKAKKVEMPVARRVA